MDTLKILIIILLIALCFKKNCLNLLLENKSVILVISCGIIGYYIYKNKNSKKEKFTSSTNNTTTTTTVKKYKYKHSRTKK